MLVSLTKYQNKTYAHLPLDPTTAGNAINSLTYIGLG